MRVYTERWSRATFMCERFSSLDATAHVVINHRRRSSSSSRWQGSDLRVFQPDPRNIYNVNNRWRQINRRLCVVRAVKKKISQYLYTVIVAAVCGVDRVFSLGTHTHTHTHTCINIYYIIIILLFSVRLERCGISYTHRTIRGICIWDRLEISCRNFSVGSGLEGGAAMPI